MVAKVLLTVYYFILSLGLVFGIVAVFPLFLFRYIVILLCPLIRPDLGKIVHPRTAVHAVDDLWKNPKNSELLYISFETSIDLNEMRDRLVKRIDKYGLNKLQKYFVKWMGYSFWKTDENFDIKNHLKYYVGEDGFIDEVVTEEQIYKKHNYFLTKPYAKKRSPWELLFVKNYRPKDAETGKSYSAVVFLVHHALGDGYGLLSAFLDTDQFNLPQERKFPERIERNRNTIEQLFSALAFSLTAPFKFVKYYHECMDDIDSPFIMKNRSGNYHTGVAKLSFQLFDKIKKDHGASFTSIYLAAVSAGIRSFLVDNKRRIPPFIHVFLPLPLPRTYGPTHEPLTNKITFVTVKLPIGMTDSAKRLEFITEQCNQLKTSPFSAIVSYIPLLAGALPTFMIKPLIRVKFISAVTSNFPGPRDSASIVGYTLHDWSVSGNLMDAYTGMAFANISYRSFSTIVLIGDKSIFPNSHSVQKIMDNVKSEIEFLSADNAEGT